MGNDNELIQFEAKGIRKVWHDEQWYFNIVDIIAVLTDSPKPRNYWSVLKNRLNKEGFETLTICKPLKF
jgi:prophage antirepressor-like protein